MEQNSRIRDLLVLHWAGKLSEGGKEELLAWAGQSPERKEFLEKFDTKESVEAITKAAIEQQLSKTPVWEKFIHQAYKLRPVSSIPPVRTKRIILWRMAAAAAVIAFLIGGYFLYYSGSLFKQNLEPIITQGEILPVDGQAIITLGDGSQIPLDSTGIGILTSQGQTDIVKAKDGQVIYQPDQGGQSSALINTIETTRGKKYEIVLADGSKVTLNALTQLQFPTAFTGNSRQVKLLEGEAFFEVVANNNKPFMVEVNGTNVRVVGTEFNVRKYKNEKVVKTTLFEGGIEVKKDTVKFHLKPGEELVFDSTTKRYRLVNRADLEEAAAWRNGYFKFKDAAIEDVMREIERYYDVEVKYSARVSQKFNGDIPSDLPLSTVFNILEATGGVRFIIQGREITILP